MGERYSETRGMIVDEERAQSIKSFIDRAGEIRRLKEAVRKLGDNRGDTFFISGHVGLGKTSLLINLKNSINKEKYQLVYGKCITERGALYHPFIQAFKEMSIKDSNKKKTPVFMGVRSFSDSNEDIKKLFNYDRETSIQVSSDIILKIAKEKPLIIIIEDLQWADKYSLILFRYLASRIKNSRILLIGSYRPEEIYESDLLIDTIQYLSHKQLYRKITLKPFGIRDTKKLIKSIIENDPDDFFVDIMYRKTNGNPWFLKETIYDLINKKKLDSDNKLFPENIDDVEIPEIVKNSIERLLIKLDPDIRNTLQTASILGKKFSFELLKKFLEIDEMKLLDHIDILLNRDFVKECPGEEMFEFYNNVIFETIYYSQFKGRRKLFHKKAIRLILEKFSDNIELYYGDLARHYKKISDLSKSLEYYIKQAEKYEKNLSYNESIFYYKQALDICKKVGDTSYLVDVNIRIGNLFRETGDIEKTINYHMNGLSTAKRAGFDREKIRLFCELTEDFIYKNNMDEAIEYIDKIHIIMDSSESNEYLPCYYRLKGIIEKIKGDFERSKNNLNKALKTDIEINKGKHQGKILFELGKLWSDKDVAKAKDYLNESLNNFGNTEPIYLKENVKEFLKSL